MSCSDLQTSDDSLGLKQGNLKTEEEEVTKKSEYELLLTPIIRRTCKCNGAKKVAGSKGYNTVQTVTQRNQSGA
jgi:hypothetical protein